MATAKLKTTPKRASVSAFLAKVKDPERRRDCERVAKIMRDVTGESPRMWGSSIVGFGTYRYKYETGREGEWMLTGFSPRKTDLTLYLMAGADARPELLARLGHHRTGKSCLYIRSLDDVDVKVLTQLIRGSVKAMARQRVK